MKRLMLSKRKMWMTSMIVISIFLLISITFCVVLERINQDRRTLTNLVITQKNEIFELKGVKNEIELKNKTLVRKIEELEQKIQRKDLLNTQLANNNLKAKTEIQSLTEQVEDYHNALPLFKKQNPAISDSEYKILAKLLYREAGGMSWDGKLYTCSAILNLRDLTGRSIYNMAHDANLFSVAPVVDSATPTEEIYKVIDYVLSGFRVPEICYFRTDYYHNFGTPVCEVDGHYFSKP